MPINVVIPESVIQVFPVQERDALRRLVSLISEAVDTSVGSLTLNDLSDVAVPSPTENDVLTFTDPDWTAEPAGGGGTSGSYTPTLTDEVNASAATVIGPWYYVEIGNTVICNVRLNFDSNASGGDYLGQLSFDLPLSTVNPSSLSGSLCGVDNVVEDNLSAKIYRGIGGNSGTPQNLIEIYFPLNIGQVNLYGTFVYSRV